MLREIMDFLEGWDVTEDQIKKGIEYLKKYGYINKDIELTFKGLLSAVNLFQTFTDMLEPDSIMGPKTLRVMMYPRCSMPDTALHMEEQHGDSKWSFKKLSYIISRRDNDLTVEKWDYEIETAFKQWSDVSGLTFNRVSSTSRANIILSVGSGRRDNFDGSGGTLAWMYLPSGSNYRGQVNGKFDSAEHWLSSDERSAGIYLLNVACHEIGHALGLRHSNIRTALMAPFYSPRVTKPQNGDDISRIQRLYGKPVKVEPPKPKPPKPPKPPVEPPKDDKETVIRLKGNISSIKIPGWRVSKIG